MQTAYNPVNRTILRPNIITTFGVSQPDEQFFQSPVVGRSVSVRQSGSMRHFTINESAADAMTIISVLQRLVNQYSRDLSIRNLVLTSIACSEQDNDLLGRFRSIVRFVRENLNYIPDPTGTELIVSPINLLNQIIGGNRPGEDCDGHVLLLGTLLQSIGIQSYIVGVKLESPNRFNHVIVTAYLDGAWVDVDPCDKVGVNPQYNEKLLPT